jgi:hypothetical protein
VQKVSKDKQDEGGKGKRGKVQSKARVQNEQVKSKIYLLVSCITNRVWVGSLKVSRPKQVRWAAVSMVSKYKLDEGGKGEREGG